MKNENHPSTATAVVNFILNKYMPFVFSSALMFHCMGFQSVVPYFVIAMMWFSSSYSFNCGIAHAIVTTGISLDDETTPEADK